MSLPPENNIDPTETRMITQLRHNSPFFGCRFDPSGRYVFAGGQDNAIQRWRLENGDKTTLTGHRSWIRALAFVASENKLISADYNGHIIWWQADAERPTPIRDIVGHRGWVRALAVSPNGRILASCGNDNLVKLWNSSNGELIRELRGHESHVYNVAFHPSGEFLISADHRGVVRQWNVERGTETRTFDASVLYRFDNTFRAGIGGVRSMAFSRDGNLFACAGITDVTNAFAGVGKPAIVLFEWESGNRRHLLRPRQNFRGTAWGVAFHPTGFIAGVAGGQGGKMYFWRDNNAQSFHQVNLPNVARDLDMHPDARRLAVAFYDNSVRIYEMAEENADND